MKVKQEFKTRAQADQHAKKLRETFCSVVVYPIGGKFGARNHPGPFGVSYDEKHRRTPEQRAKYARKAGKK